MIARENDAAINLFITIRRREGLSKDDFYAYWSNVHAPVLARIPHVWGYVLHHVEAARIAYWPLPAGITQLAPAEHQIEGIAEISWRDDEAMQKAYAISDAPGGYTHFDAQAMNWVGLFYTCRNSGLTLRDDLEGNDAGHGYFLAFQLRDDVERDSAIAWVRALAERANGVKAFSRIRLHTFPEYDYAQDESMMPPNMRHTAFPGEALDAVLEIAAASPMALSRGFVHWPIGHDAAQYLKSVYAYRRNKRYILRAGDVITDHGIRTPYVMDLIEKFGAISQFKPGMRELFLSGMTDPTIVGDRYLSADV